MAVGSILKSHGGHVDIKRSPGTKSNSVEGNLNLAPDAHHAVQSEYDLAWLSVFKCNSSIGMLLGERKY